MPDAPAIMTGTAPATPPNNSPFTQPINPEAQRLAAQPPKEVVHVRPPAALHAELTSDARHRLATATPGDPATTIQVRGENGETIFKDRVTGKVLGGDGNVDPSAPPPAADAGEKIRVGEFEVSEGEVRDMLAEKAQRDLARAQIPADANGYKLELSADLPLPAGIEIRFDNPDDSASVQAVQEWAHKTGLSQGQFSEMLSIKAHREAANHQIIAERARAEVDKLGSTGPQRIDALTKWIRSEMGDIDGRPIVASMCTAAHVKFYEKLFNKVVNGGAGSFRQTGREVENRGVDAETYNSWSYSEKKAYAERASAANPGRRR